MNRKNQIRKAANKLYPNAATNNEEDCYWMGFIDGAEWADDNPKSETDIIISLIHQRSVAFDYGREQAEMLEVAINVLKKYENKIPYNRVITPESTAYEKQSYLGRITQEALEKIKRMRKKSNGQIQK